MSDAAMRVLIVKTSSLGDIIHTMPAVTEAAARIPGLTFDWVIEEGLIDLVRWHPAVARPITVNYRHWRHRPIAGLLGGQLRAFGERLRETRYDAVIDAQGLYKSAVITRMADGPRHGYDLASCREKLAPLAYQFRYRVPRSGHAIDRVRALFAQSLGYRVGPAPPEFGLDRGRLPAAGVPAPYLVFLHGTAWRTKRWPVARWIGLARLAQQHGFAICMPWHDEWERRRAEAVARACPDVRLMPRMGLTEIGGLIAGAAGVVAVDTGLGHLAAALDVPAVALYGPTGPEKTGTMGPRQANLRSPLPCSPCHNKICNYTGNARAPAPCMAGLEPAEVWRRLDRLIAGRAG